MPWLSADSLLSFAKETTPGTVIARSGSNYNNVFGIASRDVALPDRQIQAKPLPSYGVGRRYAQVVKGPFTYSGSIPFTPLNGTPIYWAMGKDTYSTGVHTVTTRDQFGLPTVSLLSLLRTHSDTTTPPFQRVFPGTACASLGLSAQVGGELQAEASIMSFKPVDYDTVDTTAEQYSTSGVTFTPAVTGASAVRPYQWFDVATASDVTIGSVTIARLEEFSLRIDNRLTPKHYFGANAEPTEYITRIPQFSFSARMVPNHHGSSSGGSSDATRDALYKILMDAGTVDMSIKLSRGASDYIKIIIDDALLTQAPHSMRGDGEEVVASFQIQPRDISFEINDDVDASYSTGWF